MEPGVSTNILSISKFTSNIFNYFDSKTLVFETRQFTSSLKVKVHVAKKATKSTKPSINVCLASVKLTLKIL